MFAAITGDGLTPGPDAVFDRAMKVQAVTFQAIRKAPGARAQVP
jgi:hypothetical protein